ncbi:MAG TPA: rhomboid family intramembrane serine protease [Pirellulaceae bacterium]
MFIPLGDNIQHRSFPFVPCLLIGLNVLVFAYETRMTLEQRGNPSVEIEFAKDWGLIPADMMKGKVLGLITHMFVHGGVMHLVGNMLVLWAFAASLEVGLGYLCFLAFYMLWGIVAGLTHAAMDLGSEVPMVGASGAIAGLIGAYTVAYGYDAKIRCLFFFVVRYVKVEVPAILFGMAWFGGQLWDASSDPQAMAGVAWYAHIGGFVAGALTMWMGRSFLEQQLAVGDDGQPIFVDKDMPPPADAIPTTHREIEFLPDCPDQCPHCETDLAQAGELTAGLVRCPNPECERLVYRSEMPVA